MTGNASGSSLESYEKTLATMRSVRHGEVLARAARNVLEQLGHDSVVLLSESIEGIALAGAVSAIRDEPTVWAPLEIRKRGGHKQFEGRVVVIEPVPPPAGLLEAIERSHPDAEVISPRLIGELLAA